MGIPESVIDAATCYTITMNKLIALFCLVAICAAQDFPKWFNEMLVTVNRQDDVIDRVHNFRLECHPIEVDQQWEMYLTNSTFIPDISEEIVHLIQGRHAREVQISEAMLIKNYGDNDATQECANHTIWAMIYEPSPQVLSG